MKRFLVRVWGNVRAGVSLTAGVGRTVVGAGARVVSGAKKKNHMIEAAPFGRLDQMLFFGAADDTGAADDRLAGRPARRSAGRMSGRTPAVTPGRTSPQTLTKNRFTDSNYGNRRESLRSL